MTLSREAFENTMGKGENAGNQHFLPFPQCFLLYQGEKPSLQQYFICQLQIISIWSCWKMSFSKESPIPT